MEKITLMVDGMSCAHCEKAIVNELSDMGVYSVVASAPGNVVEVEFDAGVVTLAQIKDELQAMGYTVA